MFTWDLKMWPLRHFDVSLSLRGCSPFQGTLLATERARLFAMYSDSEPRSSIFLNYLPAWSPSCASVLSVTSLLTCTGTGKSLSHLWPHCARPHLCSHCSLLLECVLFAMSVTVMSSISSILSWRLPSPQRCVRSNHVKMLFYRWKRSNIVIL